jgi:hypothetical protein
LLYSTTSTCFNVAKNKCLILLIPLTNLDTSEFFFIYGVSGLPETSHYVDLVLSELDVGSYRLSLATNVSYLVEFDVVDRLYTRGDANLDGVVNIADVIKITAFLFQGDQTLFCQKAADTNDDGLLNIADAIYLSSYLFSGGPPPPEPFDEIGQDPTEDSLSCY